MINGRMIMNGELESIWKEVDVASFKIFFYQHLAGGGEEILNNFVCDVPAKNLVIV
jgi:hypothetical protein